MKNYIIFFTTLIIGIVLSGCARPAYSVYYDTELDPTAKIDKQKRIYVMLTSKYPTIEDKKFKILLENQLIKNGFNVAKDPLVDYIDYGISFLITDKSYSGVSSYTSYTPTTSYSSGYVGNTYVHGSTTSTTPVSNTYSYTNTYKKIYLQVIAARRHGKTSENEIIWTGFMSSNIDGYDENLKPMMDEMAKLVGKEYKGYIDIQPIKKEK